MPLIGTETTEITVDLSTVIDESLAAEAGAAAVGGDVTEVGTTDVSIAGIEEGAELSLTLLDAGAIAAGTELGEAAIEAAGLAAAESAATAREAVEGAQELVSKKIETPTQTAAKVATWLGVITLGGAGIFFATRKKKKAVAVAG